MPNPEAGIVHVVPKFRFVLILVSAQSSITLVYEKYDFHNDRGLKFPKFPDDEIHPYIRKKEIWDEHGKFHPLPLLYLY